MRIAAFVLGLLGGIFGMFMALIAMAVGGTSNALEEGSGNEVVGLGFSGLLAAIVALVAVSVYFGGKLPRTMCVLLLVTAIWHVISIGGFGVPGFILLLLAAILGWFGAGQRHEQTA